MSPCRIAPLLLLVACATAAPHPDSAPTDVAHADGARTKDVHIARSARDPITEAEIVRTNAGDTYDLVRTLRSSFLNSRGMTTLWKPGGNAYPVVFVDGMFVGPIDELRSIPANTVHEVRFLSASEAQFRYGSGYTAGVIHVTTKQ